MWSWYKDSYNNTAHVSVDVKMFVPKIRKIDQPVFNRGLKNNLKDFNVMKNNTEI